MSSLTASPVLRAISLPTASWPELELLGERLVDDRHLAAAGDVGARELAARQQRNAHRLEESRAHLVVRDCRCRCPGPASKPSTDTPCAELLPTSSADDRDRHARRRPAAPAGRPQSARTARACAQDRSRSAAARSPNVTMLSILMPRSTRLTLSRLRVNKPGGRQQRHRQRDLGDDQRLAEPRRRLRAGGLTACCP